VPDPVWHRHIGSAVNEEHLAMMKHALAVVCMLAAAPALAQFGPGNPDTYGSIWEDIFMKRMKMTRELMDKSKDGMVSKDEYMAYAEMTAGKQFMMMDMNNDGMISEAEFMNPDLGGWSAVIFGGGRI
jgi:hypothetical protein